MAWKNPWYDPDKAHHTPTGFRNPEPESRAPDALKRWRAERKANGFPHAPVGGYGEFTARWWQPVEHEVEGDGVWWLGHASLLLRISGRYILTDPVFSRRASPLFFYGPARKTPSPLKIEQLPQLDAVLISHNHYDHLDSATLRQIRRRFPNVHYYVPLGLGNWLRKRGVTRYSELDWWQSAKLDDLTITSVPARHWSMRTPWDRNRSLWCGWVVASSELRFWFSGDSGVSPSLAEIATRLGPIDAAALPIGAFAPRWFMSQSHMDPQASVALWQALERPVTIPMHWAVFELTDEALDEPPQELARALAAAGEQADDWRFSPRRIGEFIPLVK